MSLFSAHGLAHLVHGYGPWLVGAIILLEAMGLPLPAESVLIATAAYAGTSHGGTSIIWIIVSAAAGAILGDNLGYLIGRTLGWRALRRWGRHIGINQDRLLLGAYLFRRHGVKVVFVGRFIVILRTLSALLAGANRMGWWYFLPANAAGGILWVSLYSLVAYSVGKAVFRIAKPAALGVGVLAVGVLVAAFFLIRRREHELIAEARRTMGEPAR